MFNFLLECVVFINFDALWNTFFFAFHSLSTFRWDNMVVYNACICCSFKLIGLFVADNFYWDMYDVSLDETI